MSRRGFALGVAAVGTAACCVSIWFVPPAVQVFIGGLCLMEFGRLLLPVGEAKGDE